MSTARILIVEDELIVAQDLKNRLNLLGYALAGSASSAATAIAVAEELRPDLVLMDIRLEGNTDGIAAAERIHRDFRVPVVFLTAYSDDATLERAKLAEPFGYILKPFDDRELKTIIEMALYKARADEEICRLQRLYATLSQVNQTIVRARSPQELYPAIVRIAIEFGKFKAARLDNYDPQPRSLILLEQAGAEIASPSWSEPIAGVLPCWAPAVWEAARKGKTSLCQDALDEAKTEAQRELALRLGVRSFVATPFRFQGEINGLLSLAAGEPFFFQEAEVRLVEEIALDISFALDQFEAANRRRRAETTLQQRVEELATLNMLSRKVNTGLSLEQTSKAALAAMLDAVHPDLAFLFLLKGEQLVLQEVNPPRIPSLPSLFPEHFTGECLSRLTLRDKKPFYSLNMFTDPRCTCEECRQAGLRSFAALPLFNGGQIIGVIGLASVKERDFERQDRFLETLAGQIAAALANACLYDTVQHELSERRRAEAALRESRQFLADLIENSGAIVFVKDCEGHYQMVNRQWETVTGLSRQQVIGKTDATLFPDFEGRVFRQNDLEAMESGKPIEKEEVLSGPQGLRHFISIKFPLRDEAGRVNGVCGMATETTAYKKAEAIRRLDESRLETQLRLSHMTGASLDEIAAFALEEAVRLTQSEVGYVAFANEDETVLTMHAWSSEAMRQCRTKETPREFVVSQTGLWGESIRQRRAVLTNDYDASPSKKGTPEGHVQVRRHLGVPIFDGDRIVIVAGVANKSEPYGEAEIRQLTLLMNGMWQILKRQRAEQERQKLHAQLLQAQKMESVGRLAGGVAHDFNNMLQAILGNANLALQDLPPNSSLHDNLEEIRQSAERSAALTRQLLAFARKQTIAPKVLDLNETVAGMLKMLRRIIGENIDLAWLPGSNLWPVKMDPSQIDQILANLCVNARDAISNTGQVAISTENAVLDLAYAASLQDCAPGDYVMLAISDTGHGMNADQRSHLFEPFFTTKQVGKGTGLGLATVFGIVKQNAGAIDVYTEPDQGTTFKIYLPRTQAPAESTPPAASKILGGSEIILLVEDEKQILNLGLRILRQKGYTALAASTPEEAQKLAAEHAGPIHLLITDVVMPHMNGKELYAQLQAYHPNMQCLYMSGYTADVIASHGVLDEGVHFLQKPFSVELLTRRVREILNQREAGCDRAGMDPTEILDSRQRPESQ